MSRQIANNSLVRAAMKAPYLQREHEHALTVRWKERQDQEALHEVVVAHMRLVISMAAKFRRYGLPMSELIQEGHVGLLEAAARFDPGRGVRFSTYAAWWIRASMQDFILRNWSIVRGGTSSSQKALFFGLRRLRAKLARLVPGAPDRVLFDRIASTIGVSSADVALMDARLSAPDQSLNTPVGDRDDGPSGERQDLLVSDAPLQDQTVGGTIDGERRSRWLREAMEFLDPREREIIERRRLRESGATLESLGDRLGVSKERVRQIENRALAKLKIALLERHPDAAPFVT
ncbi:RNA polymerase factor sigma-32 [Nitratireductor sp. CAU 1489]|uniref:RNA polymerase factor sigma-32 n=1 Tax=Nitratireductor arenosus TaxID=2682096 RepID=A0A844QF38_9HYPH|nr:RNA polymerase factor sigma-32 [Nitratireductor arenosus]MVA96409.1 RNA polymerase factor sigma-32 [Nitratireductor arenosus]